MRRLVVTMLTGAAAGWAGERLAIPAAWLLGPMVVAIAFACTGPRMAPVPPPAFRLAQGVIGCAIARALDPRILSTMMHSVPLLLALIIAMIAMSTAVAWLLARTGTLDPATSTLGSSIGAASAMTVLAVDYGADARIVAFMQYLRVVAVVASAAFVAHIVLHGRIHAFGATAIVADAHLLRDLVVTLGIILIGTALAKRFRIPSGNLLVPMILASVLTASGTIGIVVPWWLLEAAYLVVGTTIGLLFTRAAVLYVLKMLPKLLLGTVSLVVGCGALSVVVAYVAHLDLLTSYLALSPGGLDSIAIIALNAPVNLPFVVAVQTARLFVVILLGPSIARFVAARLRNRQFNRAA